MIWIMEMVLLMEFVLRYFQHLCHFRQHMILLVLMTKTDNLLGRIFDDYNP